MYSVRLSEGGMTCSSPRPGRDLEGLMAGAGGGQEEDLGEMGAVMAGDGNNRSLGMN